MLTLTIFRQPLISYLSTLLQQAILMPTAPDQLHPWPCVGGVLWRHPPELSWTTDTQLDSMCCHGKWVFIYFNLLYFSWLGSALLWTVMWCVLGFIGYRSSECTLSPALYRCWFALFMCLCIVSFVSVRMVCMLYSCVTTASMRCVVFSTYYCCTYS